MPIATKQVGIRVVENEHKGKTHRNFLTPTQLRVLVNELEAQQAHQKG